MSYPYGFGVLTAAAGTVTVVAATQDVVGVGTAFLTHYASGDPIIVAGEWRRVSAFNLTTPNTDLLVDVDWSISAAGVTPYKLVLTQLDDDLGIPAPKSDPVLYSQPLDLGNGGVRGGGWAMTEWHWGFLSQAHREILRTYIPGASAQLLIRTSINDGDGFYDFLAQAIWPPKEPKQAGRRLDFTLRFRAMQQMSFPLVLP